MQGLLKITKTTPIISVESIEASLPFWTKTLFVGDTFLAKNVVVRKEKCEGFVPCEMYKLETYRSNPEESFQFFIKILPNQIEQEGHLEMLSDQGQISVDFLCKKIVQN